MAVDGDQSRTAGVQKLDRALNSIEDVLLALQSACTPARPVSVSPSRAVGLIAAQNYVALQPVPPHDEALVDGRAVASADLIGASSMSPAFAMLEPPFVRVGDSIPANCDCVIDDALVVGAGGVFEIHGAAAPGDGVRRVGDDLGAGSSLLHAGARVSLWDAHILETAGFAAIDVRRPRVRVVASSCTAGDDGASRWIAALARDEGLDVELSNADPFGADALDGDWDAALVVGGAGLSVDDHSVHALRRNGRVIAHGFALDPGRTGAAGFVGEKPVVCLPGRFDSAVALYLALVRPLLRHLSGAEPLPHEAPAPLTRKIASSVGVAQICLLEAFDGRWALLSVGDLTLAGLRRAQAYMIISQGSEGLAEGAKVRPFSMPGRSACR